MMNMSKKGLRKVFRDAIMIEANEARAYLVKHPEIYQKTMALVNRRDNWSISAKELRVMQGYNA